MTELGTLQPLGDDTYRLVFVRTLRHPVDKVWRAVTEAEHLAHWFPDGMQPDFAAGARLRFVPAGNDDLAFEGEVLAFEPPTLVEFTWGTDTIRIELAARPTAGGHRPHVHRHVRRARQGRPRRRGLARLPRRARPPPRRDRGRPVAGHPVEAGPRRRTSRRSDPRRRRSASPTATRCPTERGVPTSPASRRG